MGGPSENLVLEKLPDFMFFFFSQLERGWLIYVHDSDVYSIEAFFTFRIFGE